MFVVLCLILSLLCTCSFGQIFEFADVDSFSDLWYNRYNELLSIRHRTCSVNVLGEKITGLCKSNVDCLFSGGTSRGPCGILSTCCTYERSCGRSTKSRISYFTSAGNFDKTLCSYTVNLMNQNVCQIRLDFLEFDLLPATVENNNEYNCNSERFYAEPNSFAPMCGTNKGQHLYIHIPQSGQQITLHVRRSRPQSRWNIRVTQLECGRGSNRDGRHTNSVNFALLAPPGCLQYYTEATGTFRNFGYNGPYVRHQEYSICFRRTPDICGVKFSPQELVLGPVYACEDIFYIPNPGDPSRCGQDARNFEINLPGPLYVTFIARSERNSFNPDVRFRINYELTLCK